MRDDELRVTAGPWENGHRPSVDALFRSAARWHGSSVIAVVLSGALDDGAAGVAAVAEEGGDVLIQDPAEAEVPDICRAGRSRRRRAPSLPHSTTSLFEVDDRQVLRFRCRVGHASTADALTATNGREIEAALWAALRVLEEDDAVRARLASRARGHNRPRTAHHYDELTAERKPVMSMLRDAIAQLVGDERLGADEAETEAAES